jgi:hypothetical protein
MAKVVKGRGTKRTKADDVFPFDKENYYIMGVGLLFIVAGYIALAGGHVTGFRELTLAPLLLVIGYCVIIPIGIVYRKKAAPAPPAAQATSAQATPPQAAPAQSRSEVTR